MNGAEACQRHSTIHNYPKTVSIYDSRVTDKHDGEILHLILWIACAGSLAFGCRCLLELLKNLLATSNRTTFLEILIYLFHYSLLSSLTGHYYVIATETGACRGKTDA